MIFHSYVSLPEGKTFIDTAFPICSPYIFHDCPLFFSRSNPPSATSLLGSAQRKLRRPVHTVSRGKTSTVILADNHPPNMDYLWIIHLDYGLYMDFYGLQIYIYIYICIYVTYGHLFKCGISPSMHYIWKLPKTSGYPL